MKKIKHELNGKMVEIEVTDSIAESYEKIEQESKRSDWKYDWRNRKNNISFEQLEESGRQIVSEKISPDEELEMQEEIAFLRKAIKNLTQEQQWLIKEVYFKGRKQSDIANELGVTEGAIRHRLEKTYKKIKNFFN